MSEIRRPPTRPPKGSPCWAVTTTRSRTLAHARAAVGEQLTAYRALVKALGEASTDPKGTSALEALEPLLFNNMVLVLSRHVVHRLRMVTGTDGGAPNEVELRAHSLIHNDAVLRANDVIRYAAEKSVLQLGTGDRIRLSAAQLEELSAARLTLATRGRRRSSAGLQPLTAPPRPAPLRKSRWKSRNTTTGMNVEIASAARKTPRSVCA